MNGRDRQQRRDGRVPLVVAAVGDDEQVVPLGDGLGRLHLHVLDGLAKPGATVGHREEGRERDGAEAPAVRAPVERADAFQLLVGEDRGRDLELVAGVGLGLEEVPLRTDRGLDPHDDLLADRVHGRVRDLREELLEVPVEELGLLGEHGQRSVGAHGADRLATGRGHGVDDGLEVLRGVAEGLLAPQHRLVIGLVDRGRRGQVLELHEVLLQPLRVWLGRRDPLLQLVVGDDALLAGVDEEHAARLQPPLLLHVLHRDVEDAHLGRHDHQAVVGDVVPGWAQAVAVERGAHQFPVGEGDRRRPVPGLHQAGVELVEGLLLRAHRLVLGPGLRHHHHHGVRQRPPREVQELEHVVEHGRVGAVGVDDGEDLLEVVAEEPGRHLALARVHPVDVAAQRVDLAVVGDEPVRVGAGPAGEGVGGEPGVDHGDGRRHLRVGQVRIELAELAGVEHALVDDGAGGEARHVVLAPARDVGAQDRLPGEPPDHVELPLEGHPVVGDGTRSDEHLADHRLAGLGHVSQRGGVERDVAPAQHQLSLGPDDLLELPLAGGPARQVGGQEDHADGVAPGARELDAELRGLLAQEDVRILEEDPGPVAGVLLRAGCAAVLEVDEHLEGLLYDGVGLPPRDVHHEPEATGVVLAGWVVESLLLGQPLHRHL